MSEQFGEQSFTDAAPNDTPKTKDYELPGGIVVTSERRDPYGFFHLSSKTELPVKYTGAYTSTPEVERAMREYTNELNNSKKKSSAPKGS